MKIAAPEVNFVLADSADIVVISSIRVLMLVIAASRLTRLIFAMLDTACAAIQMPLAIAAIAAPF